MDHAVMLWAPSLTQRTPCKAEWIRVPYNLALLAARVASTCTVTRIDGKLHQPDRMAPDQTIRAMGNNSAFTIEILGFYQRPCWHNFIIPKSSMRFPFPKMKTPDISKFSDEIPFSKDGNSRPFQNFPMRFPFPRMETLDHFEIFR
jgi:hypothetical protein